MTHNNNDDKLTSLRDWVDYLNWKPGSDDGERRVFLQQIGGHLASRSPFQGSDAEHLRRLLDVWLRANRDFDATQMLLPDEEAKRLRNHMKIPLRAALQTDRNGRVVPSWLDDQSSDQFDIAAALFLRIAAHVEGWRLSGPCAECGRYFLRQRRRETKYCSRKCLRRESSPRMRTARLQEHAENLRFASEAVSEFVSKVRREPWKPWVARYILKRTGRPITTKSLTRWINIEAKYPGQGLKIPRGLALDTVVRPQTNKK